MSLLLFVVCLPSTAGRGATFPLQPGTYQTVPPSPGVVRGVWCHTAVLWHAHGSEYVGFSVSVCEHLWVCLTPSVGGTQVPLIVEKFVFMLRLSTLTALIRT